eukprot:3306960-Amphidinium_carterae.1
MEAGAQLMGCCNLLTVAHTASPIGQANQIQDDVVGIASQIHQLLLSTKLVQKYFETNKPSNDNKRKLTAAIS